MIRPLRAIVLETRIDASPADVWHALTDGQAMSDWFAPFMKAGQGIGGIVEMSWDGTNFWPSTIEVWDPERHVSFANGAQPAPDGTPEPRLLVDWFITSDAGQTVLRLVHSGFGPGAEWDDQIDSMERGWTYFVWNLEVCLTRHRGRRRTMVSARPRVTTGRDAFWDSLFASGFIAVHGSSDAPATCTITLGDQSFDAVVQMFEPGHCLAARVPGLEDSLLFIELEGTNPTEFHTGFWLSTYGLEADTSAGLQQSLGNAVARLTSGEVPAAL
jgi:uncharacterized protein YndB with AHSA1/START domain